MRASPIFIATLLCGAMAAPIGAASRPAPVAKPQPDERKGEAGAHRDWRGRNREAGRASEVERREDQGRRSTIRHEKEEDDDDD